MASVPTRHDRAPRSGVGTAGGGMPGVWRRRGDAARRGESDPSHFPLSCFDTLCLDNPADAVNDPIGDGPRSTGRRPSRPRRGDPPPARWPPARHGYRCEAHCPSPRPALAGRSRRCAEPGPARQRRRAVLREPGTRGPSVNAPHGCECRNRDREDRHGLRIGRRLRHVRPSAGRRSRAATASTRRSGCRNGSTLAPPGPTRRPHNYPSETSLSHGPSITAYGVYAQCRPLRHAVDSPPSPINIPLTNQETPNGPQNHT